MTEELPHLAIALITYERTECALRTVVSVQTHLDYPNVGWYVADDGSRVEHTGAILSALHGCYSLGVHSERLGVGKSQNRALAACFAWADYVLFLEDDWELRAPLDPRPYMRILEHNPDVGMVRLGGLAVGLDCHSVGYDGRHYLRMNRSTQYAFSGNPSIRHRRFHDWYGGYCEGKRPGETEVEFDGRFRAKDGPNIV